ncbi:hypothetical protein HYX19_05010 [Candidatus Woesearchaeota archaeon]|nr:hypothetical protein [Candidatus Woesearchaeota archaeon]
MKLQKQFSREYSNKRYSKYVIVVKTELVKKLDWKGGEYLNGEVKNNKLILNKEN